MDKVIKTLTGFCTKTFGPTVLAVTLVPAVLVLLQEFGVTHFMWLQRETTLWYICAVLGLPWILAIGIICILVLIVLAILKVAAAVFGAFS